MRRQGGKPAPAPYTRGNPHRGYPATRCRARLESRLLDREPGCSIANS